MNTSEKMKHTTLLDERREQVRRVLPRSLRRLGTIVLTVLLAVSLIVTAAAFRPFDVTLPTPMFAYSQSITPDYSVNLVPGAQFSDRTLPAGRIYMRDYAESVTVRFDISQRAAWLGSLASRSHAEAVLQVISAQNPSVLLMERKSPLLPLEESAPSLAGQAGSRSLTVPLAPYREAAAAFLKESGAAGNGILTVRLTAEMAGSRFGQPISTAQAADVAIPLTAESFQIAAMPASSRQMVTRPIRYLVQPEGLPLFAYPAVSALLLLALVLFLAMTASRPVRQFQRELRKLLRQGRRQILMIGDKAWEPEWCVTVSDFSSMVQTARRLRHPIFCHVDTEKDPPAAYFYVYYGENNYCYVFSGKAETHRSRLPASAMAGLGSPSLPTGRLGEPKADDRAVPFLAHAPALTPSFGTAGASGAGAGTRSSIFGDPAHAMPDNASDRLGVDAAARFQTGAFKPLGDSAAPATVVPSAIGPMMPSPEPYLDLIRDPWPGASDSEEPKTSSAAHARPAAFPSAIPAPDRQVPGSSAAPADSTAASPEKSAASTDMTAATPEKAAAPTEKSAAPAAGDRSSETAPAPVPILPETDASFFHASLF